MATQKTYSFRPSPEVETDLIEALGSTNLSVTDLLTRCVRHSLLDVVAEIETERRRRTKQFLKERGVPYRVKKG